MMTPSGSAVNLGVAVVLSVGHAWFEFILPLPIADGVVARKRIRKFKLLTKFYPAKQRFTICPYFLAR